MLIYIDTLVVLLILSYLLIMCKCLVQVHFKVDRILENIDDH